MKEERMIPYPKTWTLRWFILMFKNMCEDAWYFITFKRWRKNDEG
jgi:hypothetical protein